MTLRQVLSQIEALIVMEKDHNQKEIYKSIYKEIEEYAKLEIRLKQLYLELEGIYEGEDEDGLLYK